MSTKSNLVSSSRPNCLVLGKINPLELFRFGCDMERKSRREILDLDEDLNENCELRSGWIEVKYYTKSLV
jgi:hypothetical protein